MLFTIKVGICSYFLCFNWYLKKDLFVLSLVPALKQQFNELINGKSQTNRDQKSNLLFLQQHNIKEFNSSLLKIDKKSYKDIDIYYIGYITIKKIGDCENIHSLNPLYLLVNHAKGYIAEKNRGKYLIFDDSVNENKALLENYADVWDGIKNEIKAINDGKKNDYEKDYMQIKFNSDDDLPLNKPLKFNAVTIIIRSAFEEGGKLYPQVFLDDTFMNYENVTVRKH